MQVFKFGGASVKHADAVRNVGAIIQRYPDQSIAVVVSAMGKTTNALEHVVEALRSRSGDSKGLVEEVKAYHRSVIEDLRLEENRELQASCAQLWREVDAHLDKPMLSRPDYLYDQVVSAGELISTLIVHHYLVSLGLTSQWFDSRELIKTDYRFREAHVDWKQTEVRVNSMLKPYLINGGGRIAVTQGFMGAADHLNTTTLGREGSDYSAAILAFALEAESVCIWKDVPGLLNADPKHFEDTQLLPCVSYKEAIELAYYGASVIHSKTVQPLQNKGIPLHVRSFVDPDEPGTLIAESTEYDSLIPSFIVKRNQRLISLSTRDFAFVVEDNLSDIFEHFARHGVQINIMQNSAINFSVSVDDVPEKLDPMIEELHGAYKVLYNRNLELITIRHYTQEVIDRLTQGRTKLVEQRTRHTYRVLVR